MPRFAVTEKAGRFVAGQTNPGAGTVLELTEKQAEHEVRLGTLLPLDAPADEAEAPPETSQDDAGKALTPAGGDTPKKGKKAAPAPAPEADGAAKTE